MTAFDYSRPLATANRLLSRFGQAAVLIRYAPGGGPQHNPGPPTPTNHACTIVVDTYRAFEIDGTMILAGDKKVLLSVEGLAITPTTADKLQIGGVAHTIINVETLSPGGTTLLYTLQVRT